MNKPLFPRKILMGLLALTLLSSCGKGCGKGGMGGGGKIDPLDVIPASSNLLISLNLKKMQSAPMFSEMMKDAPPEAKEISKDVDEAILALNLRGPAQAPSGLAIVTGSFDEKKVLGLLDEAAKKSGGEVKKETFEGKTLYLSPKDPNIGMTFLSPNQAMWGQISSLKEAITLASKKGESVRSNKELMDLFNKRDSKKMLYGVGLVPPGATPPAQPGDPMAALQGVKAFSLGIDYDKDLSIDLTANTQDAGQAQNLMNLINSYKTIFGASLATQQPALGQVLQGLQVSSNDKALTLSLKVAEPVVKQLTQMVASQKGAAGGPPMGMPGDAGMPPPPPTSMPGAPAIPPPPAPPPAQPSGQAAQPAPPSTN